MTQLLTLFQHLITSINFYLIALLAVTSIIGDFLVSHAKLHIFQAVFDNTTHSIIGGLSWFIVCLNSNHRAPISEALTEILLCAVIASLIDVDHFVAARSINLKDATNLQKRPPLHCTTFPVLFCAVILFIGFMNRSESLKKSGLIVLTAFLSHHTRDATRRGYWFYPFGSTTPIHYEFYIVITCFIPYFILGVYNSMPRDKYHHVQINV